MTASAVRLASMSVSVTMTARAPCRRLSVADRSGCRRISGGRLPSVAFRRLLSFAMNDGAAILERLPLFCRLPCLNGYFERVEDAVAVDDSPTSPCLDCLAVCMGFLCRRLANHGQTAILFRSFRYYNYRIIMNKRNKNNAIHSFLHTKATKQDRREYSQHIDNTIDIKVVSHNTHYV